MNVEYCSIIILKNNITIITTVDRYDALSCCSAVQGNNNNSNNNNNNNSNNNNDDDGKQVKINIHRYYYSTNSSTYF